MSPSTRTAGTPPLNCTDCGGAIVRIEDTKFVCLGCDTTYPVTKRSHRDLSRAVETTAP